MTVYTEIKNLIGKSKLEEALEVFLKIDDLNETTNNQLLILSGQYYRWKVNNRIGTVDDSNLHKIQLGLLELIDEIKSAKDNKFEIEATEIHKIDFNVPKDEAVEVIFHYRHRRIKEKILVPKKITLQELTYALVSCYNLKQYLPRRRHKVEWILLVNHRKVTDENGRIKRIFEKRGIKNGDNVLVEAVVTKYKIKMKDDKPKIEEKKGIIPCSA